MSGTIGKSKDTSEKDGFRQFVINCLGENDQRKYFSLSPFGFDFNLPENTRVLTLDSKNKDIRFSIGVLNKKWLNDLLPGENAIFSTDEAGEELVSKVVFRNIGDIEINKDISGNAFILIKADGTIEFNGDADNVAGFTELKAGFDTLKDDLNSAIAVINTIRGDQNTFATAYIAGGPAVQGLPPAYVITSGDAVDSEASIDDSKKDNLKTE